jgi:predicted CxxxxCH...CXXCH cytochrome family protein
MLSRVETDMITTRTLHEDDSKESGMKFINTKAFTTRVLFSLALASAGVAGLSGSAEAASCLSCHAPVGSTTDIRPVESTYRNITTGSVRGSHVKHIPSPTLDANSCTPCHGTLISSTNHRNGFINVTSASGLGYSKKASFPQSGSPTLTLGSCNTASCHANVYGSGTVPSPVWGIAAPNCTACHTVAIGPNGPGTGSHTNILAHAVACTSCHAAGTSATTPPSTGHLDGIITVTNGYPSAVAKHASGSYATNATCNTASCHINVYGAGTVTTPVWGSTGNGCLSCHTTPIAATGPATGSHAVHNDPTCTDCHAAGTTATVAPTTGHIDGNVTVTGGYPIVAKHVAGTYAANATCSTSTCHGTKSPVWGANTGNDKCTKCHGTGTVTVTVANRAVIAPSDPAATDTGKVSSNAKTGAHQTHLLFLNGLSAQGTQDSRCSDCHGTLPASGAHANGSSTPVFQGLATHSGTMTSASFTGGSCSSTYCHNPAGTGGTLNNANTGTGITPSWTNAAYIADGTLKTQANCGVCHKSPGDAGFTSTTTHVANITQDCAQCHGHNGGTGGVAGQQHIDGILNGTGSCNSCHGYQAGSWAAAPTINAEGKGAHEIHITYLTTKRFGTTIALNPASDQYASAATTWTNVCGICHANASTKHRDGAVDVALSQTYLFGTSPTVALYNGTPATSSATAGKEKTCSNLSCHYFTTPVWSTY